MKTLIHSALVERISLALLHSLWQIAVIGIALVVLRWLVRGPQARHFLSMLALLGCVLWPVMGAWQPEVSWGQSVAEFVEAEGPVSVEVAPGAQNHHPVEVEKSVRSMASTLMQTAPSEPNRLLPWLGLVWVAGVLLLMLRQVVQLVSLHRLRTRGVNPVPQMLAGVLDEVKARLRVRRAVRLVQSARARVPMVIGTLRPVIVLPVSLVTGLPLDQLEALIAHEMAHLRRWDDVWNLLQCVLDTLLFFHPVAWWISRMVRQDRELCADDLATARGVERKTLALALGRLALFDAGETSLAATSGGQVLWRIQRLLRPSPAVGGSWALWLVLMTGVFCGFALPAKAELPPRGRILDRNDVVLAESPSALERKYPQEKLAAHVIGYVGDDAKTSRLIGRSGLEFAMDEALTAKKDVRLTLDADLQRSTERALEAGAPNGGAAVVVDVQNGDILVMASSPSFDPNAFVPAIAKERWEQLNNDERIPVFGRAFQANYFPAATFKLVTALAALEKGVITEETEFHGDASFKLGTATFRNWHTAGEGPMNVVQAIKRSNNVWFYQAALATGAAGVISMAERLGFGQATGIPVRGESKGFLPTDAYYVQRYGHKILPGFLCSISIGQITEATPLQQALAIAAIANGGRLYKPRLLSTDPVEVRTDLLATGVKPEHLDLVKKGMLAVVNSEDGTGKGAALQGIAVAGKTGTAQWKVYKDSTKNRNLSWFVGYAPADRPKIAFSVVYEGAPGEQVSGGKSAAPIAGDIVRGILDELEYQTWSRELEGKWLDNTAHVRVLLDGKMVTLVYPKGQSLLPDGTGKVSELVVLYKEEVSVFRGDVRVSHDKKAPYHLQIDSQRSEIRKVSPRWEKFLKAIDDGLQLNEK
jgi:beta-lactamase regulating signal transducer with metallopeptidase domain/beta-lactamase class D